MFKKISIILSMLALVPLIAGCLEIEERVSIAPDGESALRFKMRMSIPAEMKKKKGNPAEEAKGKFKEVGKSVEGIELTKVDVKDEYGQMVLTLGLKANSFAALSNAYDTFPKDEEKDKAPDKDDELEKVFSKDGFYTIRKKGNRLVIERKIGTKKQKKKAKGKEKDAEMLSTMLGGVTMRFDLEVPSKVISSNAEEVDGQTLHWVIPLAYLDGHQVTLRAEIEATPELAKVLTGK
jgi:hypothetical protein